MYIGPHLSPYKLQDAILYFDFRSVGFDMTKARCQIMYAAHDLGEHLSTRTIFELLCRFQQVTKGAPDSHLHLTCGSLLAPELLDYLRGHESQSDHLKRLSNLMELLDAKALDDRMRGRDTYDQPAFEDG